MPKIIIYSTPTCVYCKLAKDFFKKNNLTYEEKNILTDLKARQEMVEKSGQMGVPVIKLGSKIIVGFDQTTIKSALNL